MKQSFVRVFVRFFAERRKNFCRKNCFSTKNALRAFFASRFVFRCSLSLAFTRKPTRISFASLRFSLKSISMLFRLADNLEFFVKKVPQELLFPRNAMRLLDFSFLQFLRFLAQKFVMEPFRFELKTGCLWDSCSNPLSYGSFFASQWGRVFGFFASAFVFPFPLH